MTGTWSIELAFAQEVVGGPTQGNTGSAGAQHAQFSKAPFAGQTPALPVFTGSVKNWIDFLGKAD